MVTQTEKNASPIDRVLKRISATPNGNGWQAHCPAHQDDRASLSISQGSDGRALVHCHAGCPPLEICHAVGLNLSDLMPSRNGKSKIVQTYDYTDEDGNLLYQVVRMEPKSFRQRRPDGKGGWQWSLGDTRRVLYRLPELLKADPSRPVLIVEGEKDADRLADLGFVATTCPGGAGKWRDEYAEPLKGRHVVLMPDRDEAGEKHAEAVAESLSNKANRLEITTIPNVAEKGDISDWLNEHFGREEIERLIARKSRRQPAAGSAADEMPAIIPAVDLVKQYPDLRPALIDGLMRQGETANLIAASKIGKSWLTSSLALSVANGRKWLDRFACRQGRVLLIDNELHRETMSYRLQRVAEAMDLQMGDIDVLPLRGGLMDYYALGRLLDGIKAGRYAVMIVDAHYRMLPNISENDNREIMNIYNLLDHYADCSGAGWVLIHHASKGNQSEKDVTEVGAGAGSQSRATDTHIVLRPHEEDDCHVLEAAVRSFPPVDPLVLRWEQPIWKPDESLNPNQIETTQSKKRKREDDDKRQRLLDSLKAEPNSANVLARKNEMGVPRCERLLQQLVDDGFVTTEKGQKGRNETTIYRLRD